MDVDSSSRKRKHTSEDRPSPSKKPAVPTTAGAEKDLKFSILKQNKDALSPVIASTSGTGFPDSISFKPYHKPRPQAPSRPSQRSSSAEDAINTSPELLVQSSEHPKLQLVGREGENVADAYTRDYIAIYDPKTHELQVIEAQKVDIHQSVRAAPAEDHGSEQLTFREQRAKLIEDFGTKKARKAAREAAENSILRNVPDGEPDRATEAVLSTINNSEHLSKDELEDIVQAAKPIPKANLSASHPSDVYSIESLVPNGLSTLHQLPVEEWRNAVRDGMAINTASRYVSARIEAIVNSGDTTHLQILRLILALLVLSQSLKRASGHHPSFRKLPPESQLRRLLSSDTGADESNTTSTSTSTSTTTALIPESIISAIRHRFSPDGPVLSKKDIMLLHTTICALTLHIPPISGGKLYPNAHNELATHPQDIRDDLQVNQDTIQLYFRELGCKASKPLETEFAKFGVVKGKQQAARMRVMRLRVPVSFPKLKHGRRLG